MDRVSHTAFWSVISIVAAALGGLFLLSVTHAGEAAHPGSAPVSRVAELEIGVARMGMSVDHNSEMLEEVREDIKSLRVEQRQSTQNILDALRSGNNGNQ
jgi:hypothetical protein